jgi:DNA-binding MarR family transcriptional regulator
MGLREELGLPRPVETAAHEAALNILVTANLLAKEGERVVGPFGITEAQFNVLMLLRHQSDGGALDQTALGRMLVVNRSNVTGLVDRMEKAGLVVRSPDPTDRRVKQVSLTAHGRKVAEASEVPYFKRVERVLGALGAEERRALVRSLEKLRASLAAISP